MATETQPEIPVGMETLYRRFERWLPGPGGAPAKVMMLLWMPNEPC